MPRTLSSWKIRSIRLAHFTGPRIGAMRSLALAAISARVIGLSGVPRTSSIRRLKCVPSTSVTSTIAAQRHEVLQFLIRNKPDLCTRSKGPRIRQARNVVDRGERDRLVEERYGHDVLQANIGNFAIV